MSSPRKILCVSPRYGPAFGTLHHSYPLTDGVKAFMPPQGLLVVAAALPAHWPVRFIDENMEPAREEDFRWADAVLVSGMHVQRREIQGVAARAHAHGRTAVLGGPSVSADPARYPDFDYLHIGELGDAFDELVRLLGADPSRPPGQVVLETARRRPLGELPIPAYEKADIRRYFLGSLQFSSGCPYTCEFCDIPALYGRVPQLKSPERVVAELDKLVACGCTGAVYFVDDNFIAHRRAVRELLPHLVAWQERNGHRLIFACEATLNIARCTDLLEMMRAAHFEVVFCGIETPDPAALKSMAKAHNLMLPIYESIATLNRYGMEVVSGIIMGLDTDTPETADAILDFIQRSRIPMLTINLLHALPKSPLWDRLLREGRIVDDEERESNVAFRLPYDEVVGGWRRCMAEAYTPERLLARYEHQIRATYPNRAPKPNSPERASWANIRRGLTILSKLVFYLGVRGPYRRDFWRFARARLSEGDIESLIGVMLVAHHLILFAREASAGAANASHYAAPMKDAAPESLAASPRP